jgi:hypothetical protein
MALLPVLAVLALAVALGGVATVLRRAGRSPETTVAAARRHGLVVAVLGPVAGVAAVGGLLWGAADVGAGFPGTIGDALVLAPLAYALAHTLVLLIGELAWPRPAGLVRRARLVRRRLADIAPRRLLRLWWVGTVVLAGAISAGAVLGAPGGRTIRHQDGPYLRSAGPWPGWHYGELLTYELVLLLALVATALWVVINRPAVATEDERIEDALRGTSAHRVLRGATAGVLVAAGGLVGAAGNALGSTHALPGPLPVLLALLGDALLLAGVVVLCLPAPRLPVDARRVLVG